MKPKERETKTLTPAKTESNRTGKKSEPKNAVKNDSRVGRKPGWSVRKWVSALLIAFGLLLILVPLAMTHINTQRNEDIIDQFLREAQQAMSDSQTISTEDVVVPVSVEPSEPTPSVLPGSTANPDPATNHSGTSGGETPSGNEEPPSTTESTPAPAPAKKPTMSAEEIQKRMTGVLIIEKIDLRMVIMDGVDEETLRVAAGRMTETGNFDEFGNVVLAGHRSYTLGKYFNRLDELEPGDKIVVQTKTRTLEYEIYKKHIIEPDDLSITYQSDTEKILTLFTCHPVVIANQRLVVHAKQIN